MLASLTAYVGALVLLVILGPWWGSIAIGSAKALAFHGFLPRLALLPLSVAGLTLWLDTPGSYSGRQIEMVAGAADEDMMTWKFPAASKLAVLTAFAVIALGLHLSAASAEPRRQYDDRGRAYYGPTGPNVSYQQGPRTRIYVTKRSWLDAGVEVLPGDRKFTDYAFPPALGYPSFGRENKNRPIDRQPLNPPSDMGGYPQTFPLY